MPWLEPEEEDLKEWTKDIGSAFSFWSPKGGKKDFVDNRIRLMPPHADSSSGKFYEPVAVHGNLPNIGRPVYCPAKNDQQPCPACAKSKECYNRGDKNGGSEWGSTWRVMVNLVAYDDDGDVVDDEIKVWGMPKTVWEELKRLAGKLPEGTRNISHPLVGRDVIIARKGDGLNTDYRVSILDQSEVGDDVLELLESPDELALLETVYEKTEPEFIAGLLTAPKIDVEDALDEDNEPPWADDAIDADVREIDVDPDPEEIAEPEPEEKPARRSRAAAPATSSGASSARDRLRAKLGATA